MLAGTALVLGGCWDDDDKPKLVKNEEDCIKEMNDPEGCRKAAMLAVEDHEKLAPRYGSQTECEGEFGPDRCQRVERDGSSWFIPAMAGFMIGRMMDGSNSYRVQPACSNKDNLYTNGCGPVAVGAHPIYYPGMWNYAGNYSAGSYRPSEEYVGSWTGGKVAASRAAASAEAVARGGFGGSAVGEAAVGE
jgi:uncharacterized protein YgiB involved in biofilm formation